MFYIYRILNLNKNQTMKKIKILCLAFSITTSICNANNIVVANALLNSQNTTSKTSVINFDASWENSWRTSTNENNYDGAWIFVKFRKMGTLDWRHCTVTNTLSTAAPGAIFTVPTDGKGAFLYRAADGLGTINFVGNKLVWNYGVDGILDNETVEIRVFALEMVYVTPGTFQLGSGGTEGNAFSSGSTIFPYQVASNGAITVGTGSGNLNSNLRGIASGSIPAAFPKGFSAFWMMKYEASQQQFVDFLNHIDQLKANTLFPFTAPVSGTHPNLIAAQPERAMNQGNEVRLAAMADWSGLRPFSELEFEKACRGFNTPAVSNEYAWGNTTLLSLNSVNDPGLTTESVNLPATANCIVNGTYGSPVRVGIFARPTASTRALSGGTYYGIMNMGDNVGELCFTISTAGLLNTEAIHGDGFLSSNGSTDITNWQSATAYGIRGGAFNFGGPAARISERASTNDPNAFGTSNGFRMVRTAP